MSQARFAIVPTAAILDPDLNATQMRVLLVLATFSGKDNTSWPSQSTVGDLCGLARETVNRCVKVLIEKGYVKAVSRYRPDGSQTSNQYVVLLDGYVTDISPPCDPDVTGGVIPRDHRGCDRIGSHHEDNQLNTTIETPSVGSVVEQIWIASPQPAKTRSSKKLVKAAVEKTIKIITADQLVSAWQAFLRSSDAMKDGGKFVPAAHRWINDQKYEAWLPKEPDLLEQASGPTAEEQRRQDLDRCFEAFAKFGTWDGMRFGWTLKPTAERAVYPAELYARHGIRKPEGVQS